MSQQDIIATLTKPEVRQRLMNAGIVHLWLFGSYARGTATAESDVDLLYEYDSNKHTPWSRWPFGTHEYLKERLHKDVDLVSKDFIDDRIKENVLSSTVVVY